jgi:hypothetical protein
MVECGQRILEVTPLLQSARAGQVILRKLEPKIYMEVSCSITPFPY